MVSQQAIKDTLEGIREAARDAGVDPTVVISRNVLGPCMAWLREPSGDAPLQLTGWRRALVEPGLRKLWEATP